MSTEWDLEMSEQMASRRNFLHRCASAGVGAMALRTHLQLAAHAGELRPVLVPGTHHPAKANRLIILFLTGGFSHVDTFDPKPALLRDRGKVVNGASLRDNRFSLRHSNSQHVVKAVSKLANCFQNSVATPTIFA